MKTEIKSNLRNPEILEKLYRDDPKSFLSAFNSVYPEIEDIEVAKFWKTRLEHEKKVESTKSFSVQEIITVVAIGLLAAFLIKIPDIFRMSSPDAYYYKNAAIIVFSCLVLYSVWFKRLFDTKKLVMTAIFFLIPLIYINLLPSEKPGDSVILAFIHLPLLMWFIYGAVFAGYDMKDMSKRISFIRHNGDLAIVYALIAIAGGILTLITIGLFDSIDLSIEEFYMENIVISGAVAAPVIAAWLIEKFPALISKTAPLIALIFSPMVLITLIVFLITILVTGKDPYNDRDFLIVFNAMLLGVMGIIIFSVSETTVIKNQKFNTLVLFILSIVTIIVDLIALSAIFYRLGQYGLTPNRLAVLVSNILILVNLIFIMTDLFRINFRSREFSTVEITTAKFLPVYLVWIVIVVFGFPLIFWMR